MNSLYLYEGDRVVLQTHPDWTGEWSFERPPPLTTIRLRWGGGVVGEAIWNPEAADDNFVGVFVVGNTRIESGQWPLGWADYAPAACGFMFDQQVDKLQGIGVDWLIERITEQLPGRAGQLSGPLGGVGFSTIALTAFHWGAGSTVRDDVRYVNINSELYLRTRNGQVELFTLEGSPEILDPRTRSRLTVPPGRAVTMRRGGDAPPRTLSTEEMERIRAEVRDLRAGRPPRPRATPSAPAPAAADGLNATAPGVRFFEGPKTAPPLAQRQFRDRFATESTRYISWSVQLTYPRRTARTEFAIEATWLRSNGQVLNRQTTRYFADAGWTGSEHSSGFGGDQVRNWAPDTYRVELRIAGRLIATGSFTVTKGGATASPPVKKRVFDFSVWPNEEKLKVALQRLDAAIAALPAGTRRDGHLRARQLVVAAQQAYLRYRGPDRVLFSGSTDPADCPHGLVRVLRICAEDLRQTQGGFARLPRPAGVSPDAVKAQGEALRQARDSIDQAVHEATAHRGWVAHRGPNGALVQTPPGFEAIEAGDWPLALRTRNAAGESDRVVLITWRAMPQNSTYADFHRRAMEQQKQEHPGLEVLRSAQRYPGQPGMWTTYRYRWEGKEIEALLYQHPSGLLPWEVRYLAPAGRFDDEECEEIIRSLRRR
jgi:hypothetical protein